jgi:DNA-binding transcriptional MocR family regulator
LTTLTVYGFVIASDECYSEIYPDEASPPLGGLEAAQRLGRDGFRNLVVFTSLSKRSNVPGLRFGRGGRRCVAPEEVPALSHISWMRDEPGGAARQHRGVE